MGQKLREIRIKAGKTVKETAEHLGVTYGHYGHIERGNRPLPALQKVALEKFFGAEIPDKNADDNSHNALQADGKILQPTGNLIVDFYTTRARAGHGMSAVIDTQAEKLDLFSHYSNTCFFEVSGTSMINAGIEEGDRLVVRLGYRFKNEEIILCLFNGEIMVKGAAIINGRIWLFPANIKYHPWVCKDSDEFHCIGTVIEVIKAPQKSWWELTNIKSIKEQSS